MKKRLLMAKLVCGLVAACGEKLEPSRPSPPNVVTGLDLWGQAKQAGKHIKALLDADKARVVQRGAKPEIIIKNDQILINGKPVAMGQSIEGWKVAIPGKHRCDRDYGIVGCRWDELGITLLEKGGSVFEFSIDFILAPWREFEHTGPDGVVIPAFPDPRPKHPFRGYFEWDGYGIDANTQFWEIRASIDPNRNLQCDLLTNNCGSTRVRFGRDAIILLQLYETIHENGHPEFFTISWVAPRSNRPDPDAKR